MAGAVQGLIRLSKDQVGPAAEVLTRAFFNDSKLTYLLPDEEERRKRARYLFEFELRYGLRYGRVYATSQRLEGIAVWLPSEKSGITSWRAFRSGALKLRKGLGKEYMARLLEFADLVDMYHTKDAPGPHCYLFFIGVDPAFQGQGFAARLMTPILIELEKKDIPCYLNTQNERNIPLYEHFGFRVVGRVTLPGGIVHTGMMWEPVPNETG